MRRPAIALVVALGAVPAGARAWEHNIATWSEESFPLPIHLRPEPARHTSNEELAAIVTEALATWTGVSCSTLSLEFAGVADLPVAVDDDQVFAWESDAEAWIYGEAAAGATMIDVLGPDGPRVDIVFNDVYFDWVVGANTFMVTEPEWGVDPNVEVDPLSVVTHELGHLVGLAHPNPAVEGSQPDPLATMVFALLPNAQQASLAADDKLGLCAKYPAVGGNECAIDSDCGDDQACGTFSSEAVGEVRLCDELRGTFGDDCGREHYWCGGICLFTTTNFSAGYCTEFCDVHEDCPDGWGCKTEQLGGSDVRVCERGVDRGDDAGVTPVDTGIRPVDAGSDPPTTDAPQPDGDSPDGGASETADADGTDDGAESGSASGGHGRSGCSVASHARPALPIWLLVAGLAVARRRR